MRSSEKAEACQRFAPVTGVGVNDRVVLVGRSVRSPPFAAHHHEGEVGGDR